MKVCLATYQSVMLLQGGPRTQILQTKQGLEKLGVEVSLFESWEEFPRGTFDLVHLFGANIGSYHLAREIHKLGVPMVVSPIFFSRHSPTFLRAAMLGSRVLRRTGPGLWTDYGIASEICSWARGVLPNTEREKELLRKGLGVSAEKMWVVPNGVERRFCEATKTKFKEQYGLENFVLNVGHIGPARKNVLRLLQALEKVNVPAVIIGRIEENDYGRRCREAAQRNPRVLLLDALAHDSEMLASAYAACDVFALPSQFETPGIAALEAGLAGAKIVITRHGGTREYFLDHAEYVEPTSWELIHHGITTALNKPKQSALKNHILAEYLWERVADRTLAAYRQVLP